MKARELIQSAVEVVRGPSLPELHKRLETARAALLAAQEVEAAAQATLDASYGAEDDKAAEKAQADRVQARLALERAAGRVAALEGQLAAMEATEAAAELEAGRRRLAALKSDRERHGAEILRALDMLQAAAVATVETDVAIIALPAAVRGADATPGYLLGAGPLQSHLLVELEQRGIVGQPSSVERPRLADWLALGNRTLGS